MAHRGLCAVEGNGSRADIDLAGILREHGHDYCRGRIVAGDQRKVMRDIVRCRTPELGGHVDQCEAGCGFAQVFYNSCRNRHCPKCQGVSRARWLAGRMDKILPTHYFHVVITLPRELSPLVLRNKAAMYGLLFMAGSRALLELAEGYERLKARVGFTAVLHTWSQDLLLHPHLHMVVTGGGLDLSGEKWISAPNSFLVPVKALSKIVRGKFLDGLKQLYRQNKLCFSGTVAGLKDEAAFMRLIKTLKRKKWVVYSKRPFDGAEQVYSYISQYTHRVAIANGRLIDCQKGAVSFKARDNDNPGKHRVVSLEAGEFIRRFLLHVLPKGFVRIRHYGLMAPKNVNTRLAAARRILSRNLCPQGQAAHENRNPAPKSWRDVLMELTGIDIRTCPKCKKGRLIRRPLVDGEVMLCYGSAPLAA